QPPDQADRDGEPQRDAERAVQREGHRHRGQHAGGEHGAADALELAPLGGAALEDLRARSGQGDEKSAQAVPPTGIPSDWRVLTVVEKSVTKMRHMTQSDECGRIWSPWGAVCPSWQRNNWGLGGDARARGVASRIGTSHF